MQVVTGDTRGSVRTPGACGRLCRRLRRARLSGTTLGHGPGRQHRGRRHPPGAAHPDAFRPGLAASLHNQSTALAGLARREDALAASEEVVAICRELIAIVPVFRQSLARSLTSFGIRLTEKKDFDAALSADREAVAIYAALLSLDPQRYRDPLERVVRNLATHLRDLGRGEQEIADELDSFLSADDH